MNVYLLPRRGERYFLYSRGLQPEAPPDEEAEEAAETRTSRFWQGARRTYASLTNKRSAREKMLREMGSIERINVFYPSRLSDEEAKRLYQELVEAHVRKHKRWLIVDGVAAPLSAIFSIVPGPNLLLAYLAWRTVSHYKTKKGGERALSEPTLTFVKDDELDELLDVVRPRLAFRRARKIQEIGERLGLRELERAY